MADPSVLRESFLGLVRDIRHYLIFQKELGFDSLPPRDILQPVSSGTTLESVREALGECTRCSLHRGRTQIVFGSGNPDARLVFVGEGPGQEEDEQGLPFVGRAGQLLTRMIEAMGLKRREVYIANIVKCRPPNNRNPEPEEIAACEPFLAEQLKTIRPEVICALGKIAAQTLLKTDRRISQLRGAFHEYNGIKVMATFHPAYLLRNPQEKRKVWEDMQQIMRELNLPLP